jgi:hypothetical protein
MTHFFLEKIGNTCDSVAIAYAAAFSDELAGKPKDREIRPE